MNMKSHVISNRVKRIVLGVFSLGAVINLSSVTIAQTGEPSREPIIRIETGMHTALIRRIAVDHVGNFLVTASVDKTARVWELATGRLLRILRVPIGEGNEGKLYALAISPDGNLIALGGQTGIEWDKQSSVYLFDRESGRLVHRVTGLAGIPIHLVFSRDGALLATTLGGRNGVRLWRTTDWVEVGRDMAYGNSSYGADFDREGRLVTSCFDGKLCLYDRSVRLLAKRESPGGTQPYDVRFSPDGTKIAVGHFDSTKVDVLSADTLAPLYSPDTSGTGNDSMIIVAWSIGWYGDNAGEKTHAVGGKQRNAFGLYDRSGNVWE